MNRDKLIKVLRDVQSGTITPEDAAHIFRELDTEHLGFASIDHQRAVRIGYPEIVFGEGKTPDQIVSIVRSLQERQDIVLTTRVDVDKATAILKELPELGYNSTARTLLWSRGEIARRGKGVVLVVAAGTSDLPVAEEARVCAHALGNEVDTLYDVGIAGIHRLLEQSARLRAASVVIAVAGMEGALPSVVGGLVDRPVIAVPTSIGYGAAFGGIAALLGMLNSCAPGVVVVNIDNGFGAAYAATVINRDRERDEDALR